MLGTRYTLPISSVICSGFPLEVHLTLLLVGFQLVFVAFPFSTGFPLAGRKLRVQYVLAISVFWYLAYDSCV